MIQRQSRQALPLAINQQFAAPQHDCTRRRIAAEFGRITAQMCGAVQARSAECHCLCMSHGQQVPRRAVRRNVQDPLRDPCGVRI